MRFLDTVNLKVEAFNLWIKVGEVYLSWDLLLKNLNLKAESLSAEVNKQFIKFVLFLQIRYLIAEYSGHFVIHKPRQMLPFL
jgi:hypothetical protein